MLDHMLNVKVIDFGLANRLNDLSCDVHELSTHAGTPQFQAPEILSKKTYDGMQTDMFSIGVILFMIAVKSYPFKVASEKDKYYQLIIENSEQSFNQYWI